MQFGRIVSIAAVSLVLGACQTPPRTNGATDDAYSVETQAIADFYIDVVVRNGQLSLSGGSGCGDGCVALEEPDYGRITFDLFVDDETNTPPDWRFYALRICRKGDKAKHPSKCPLSKPQRVEFVATAPGDKDMAYANQWGRVMLEDVDEDLKSFQLWNMNNLVREFEYGIVVCPVGEKPVSGTDPGSCLVIDPTFKNKGRGRR